MLPASQNTTPPSGVVLTEDQFIHMLQDLWAVGYAIIPGMPMEQDVVRRCFNSLQTTFCSLEFPGDLFEMMQRVAARDDAKAEGR